MVVLRDVFSLSTMTTCDTFPVLFLLVGGVTVTLDISYSQIYVPCTLYWRHYMRHLGNAGSIVCDANGNDIQPAYNKFSRHIRYNHFHEFDSKALLNGKMIYILICKLSLSRECPESELP